MALPPLLFAGVPGGIELLVVLFIFFLLFGVPLTLLLGLGYKHLQNATAAEAETERLDQLESEVDTLRERLETEQQVGGSATETDEQGSDRPAGTDGGEPTHSDGDSP